MKPAQAYWTEATTPIRPTRLNQPVNQAQTGPPSLPANQ